MRLSGLLSLAGADKARFDALRRRDQLPFYGGPEGENARAHWRFSAGQAFALRLLLDLIGEGDEGPGGVPPAFAVSVITNALGRAREAGFRTLGDFVTERVVLGTAIFEDHGPADAERLRFSRWIACRDDELYLEVEAWATRERARPVRVLIVNAARAAEDVIARARALGIHDHAEDEPA
jgi:hypothetical protein